MWILLHDGLECRQIGRRIRCLYRIARIGLSSESRVQQNTLAERRNGRQRRVQPFRVIGVADGRHMLAGSGPPWEVITVTDTELEYLSVEALTGPPPSSEHSRQAGQMKSPNFLSMDCCRVSMFANILMKFFERLTCVKFFFLQTGLEVASPP